MVVPGKSSTQGYTQVFCLCYGYKWMAFQGVVVKYRLFFPSHSNRPFPPTFAIQREREKLRYWVGFFGVLSSPLKTAFGTIGNCRLRSH